MTMRTRVCVFKLLDGGYLRRNGWEGTYDRTAAVHLFYPDALVFWKALHPKDRADKLWGMSLEMLPKRKHANQHPLDPQQFQRYIVTMQTARLLADAATYDRQAEGYLASARYAESMAARLRQKAADLRATVSTTALESYAREALPENHRK